MGFTLTTAGQTSRALCLLGHRRRTSSATCGARAGPPRKITTVSTPSFPLLLFHFKHGKERNSRGGLQVEWNRTFRFKKTIFFCVNVKECMCKCVCARVCVYVCVCVSCQLSVFASLFADLHALHTPIPLEIKALSIWA